MRVLRKMDVHIVTPSSEGHWAPGYYYVLFEDPDGIRLEVNHVPGQAVLAENTSFNPCILRRCRLRCVDHRESFAVAAGCGALINIRIYKYK